MPEAERSTDAPTRLLTADDVAARWQTPRSTVYAQTRSGALVAVRLGRYYRYRVEDVEEFERHGATIRA